MEVNLLSDINAKTITSAFMQMDVDGNQQIGKEEWGHFLEVITRLSNQQRKSIDALMMRKEVTRETWLLKAKLGSLEFDSAGSGGGGDAGGGGGGGKGGKTKALTAGPKGTGDGGGKG